MLRELAQAQEKLGIIHKAISASQKIDNQKTYQDIACYICSIIEKEQITLDDYRTVQSYQMKASVNTN